MSCTMFPQLEGLLTELTPASLFWIFTRTHPRPLSFCNAVFLFYTTVYPREGRKPLHYFRSYALFFWIFTRTHPRPLSFCNAVFLFYTTVYPREGRKPLHYFRSYAPLFVKSNSIDKPFPKERGRG